MMLIDANVLMYAVGRDHPHKQLALQLLTKVASGEIEANVDTEILQEILHRYRSLHRWEEGQRLFEMTRNLFPDAIPVTNEAMDQALRIMNQDDSILCRDAVHAGIVAANKLAGIYSFDSDFDKIEGCIRRQP
jgi:uncharacterized protein